jgi:lysophospholipase L1-like esterase
MHMTARLARRAALVVVCAGTMVTGLVVPGLSSSATTLSRSAPTGLDLRPVVAGSGYLALGDSVTFGYREPDTTPPPNYKVASSFVGYPEDLGAALGLHVTNPACSGETSGSFIHANAQSNGCEHSFNGGPGYRSAFPLHVAYTGSQLAFAVKFLKTHPDTRLVSLMIGANDAFVCEETTSDACATEFPAVVASIEKNVTTILQAIRKSYSGQIVILNYYTGDYSTPAATAASRGLNFAQDTAAKPFGVEIANGYGAFRIASTHSGDNACTAGLLTQLNGAKTGTCGVHPSVAGQSVLAQAVAEAVKK